MTVTGRITGTGALSATAGADVSVVTLTDATNSFGSVTVGRGTLSVGSIANGGSNSALGAGTTITLGQTGSNTTGKLQFTGASGGSSNRTITIASNAANTNGGIIENTVAGQTLTLSGNIGTAAGAGSAPSLQVTGAGNGVLSGAISNATGNLSLTKNGTGTWTLNGTNTYTGTTTVSTGTLLINGNNSAATGNLTVALGATLGGNGTVGGATTINGNLNPGNSPGLQTFGSSLTLSGTSTTTLEINGTATRGTDFDGINVGTSLTYGGNLTLAIGTTFGVGSYSWNLFDTFTSQGGNFANVALSGNYTGAFSGPSSGNWTLTQANGFGGNNTWTFNQSSGDLGLNVIPEPATWALLALSLTTVTILRRRRS
jgi:autotransporter-associated beta strand protein